MAAQPLLSIVTPTRGSFTDDWLERLLSTQGEIQFVLVYPPGVPLRPCADPRVKGVVSPFKGEMMQRFVAFLHAEGRYILALDDDDFVHPEVLTLVRDYFQDHPESIVLRLKQHRIDEQDLDAIQQPWQPLPVIRPAPGVKAQDIPLVELPIAPLDIPFDKRYLIWPFLKRKDDKARHIENFNNKVWQGDYVRRALPALSRTMQFWGAITWIPRSGFDRLMGLFVQAYSFQPGQRIGHWVQAAEQIRFIVQAPTLKPPRYHFLSDFLLVKTFPQYGYFWNLFINKLSYLPRLWAKSLRWKIQQRKYRG